MKTLLTFQSHCSDINDFVLFISKGKTGSMYNMSIEFGVSECTIKNWIKYLRKVLKKQKVYINHDRKNKTFYFSKPITFIMSVTEKLTQL